MSLRERAAIVQDVVSGSLTVREVCERHELSTQCVVDWVTEFRRASLDAFDTRLRETLEHQGISAPLDIAAPHFVVARGELALPDLIQIMALGRRSGVITVAHDGLESRLWCVDGEVIDAESGKLLGLAAVYRVLAVEQGRISTSFIADIDRPTRVRAATMELLLEGARRADECNAAKRALGPDCHRLASALPPHDVELSAAERAVLNAFATPTTIAEVLRESTIGDLETLSLIQALRSRGQIVPDPSLHRSPTLRPGPSASHGPQVLSLTSGAAQLRAERLPMVRTLLLGTGAGLVLGLGVWSVLPNREVGLTRVAQPSVATGLATASSSGAATAAPTGMAPRAGIEPAPAPTPITPAGGDAPALAAALPAPGAGSEASVVEPSAPLDPSAGSGKTTASGERQPPRGPARPMQQTAKPRRGPSPAASAAAPSLEPDPYDATEAPPATEAAGTADEPGAVEPSEVPRMRIIEERVPRMRVVE